MNAERLATIITALQADMTETNIVASLNALVTALNTLASDNVEANQLEYKNKKEAFYTAVDASAFAKFPRTWQPTIEELGIQPHLGYTLRETVDHILDTNQATLALARDEIQLIIVILTDYTTAFKNILSGFEYLEIVETGPPEGKSEVSLLIPRAAIKSELKRFGEDVNFLYATVRLFSEAATGKVEEPRIIQTSSSELLILIDAACETAKLILTVVLMIQAIIGGTYKLKKLKNEAAADKNNTKIVKAIDVRIEEKLKDGIVNVENVLLECIKNTKSVGRRNELQSTVKKIVEKLIRRMNIGYKIDGDAGIPEHDEEEGKKLTKEQRDLIQSAEEVKKLAAEIRHREIPTEPVLNLPAPDEEDAEETEEEAT